MENEEKVEEETITLGENVGVEETFDQIPQNISSGIEQMGVEQGLLSDHDSDDEVFSNASETDSESESEDEANEADDEKSPEPETIPSLNKDAPGPSSTNQSPSGPPKPDFFKNLALSRQKSNSDET